MHGQCQRGRSQGGAGVIANHFLKSRPLNEDEVPKFKSLKVPTRDEAIKIYGPEVANLVTPTKIEQVAYSESEENNAAIQLILQSGSEHELGYEGIATQELLSYIAYNSAYDAPRTKEQLGDIKCSSTRKLQADATDFQSLSKVALPCQMF